MIIKLKSQSCIGVFIYTVYILKKLHPELNLKIRLLIALLEDTKEMFIDRLYSMFLFYMYKITVDPNDLHSLRESPLSSDIIAKLDIVEKEVDFILEDCEIIDSIYNPTGIYKWARSISHKLGEHKDKEVDFTGEDSKSYKQRVYSHYEAKDPDQQVFLMVDNLNNLQQEMEGDRLLTERETINKWTRKYVRLQITKHWKWSVIDIIQQASDSEKQQFNFKGETIIEKIKPSLDGLGNSKECQRDHFLVIGLFAPGRYGIENYNGYDIERMGDNFRTLIILKSNISQTNIEIPFYFNGACSILKELPKPDDSKMNEWYEYAEKHRNI